MKYNEDDNKSGLVGDSMKKKTKIIIGILVVFAILVAGISYRGYIKAHTFTLSGNEQIQSITGTVKVSSPKDTEVIFIDVKTVNCLCSVFYNNKIIFIRQAHHFVHIVGQPAACIALVRMNRELNLMGQRV